MSGSHSEGLSYTPGNVKLWESPGTAGGLPRIKLASNEIIAVLNYLLPGFISAWVYYGLTAHSKPSQFERIIQALIFTIFIQFIVNSIHWLSILLGENVLIIGKWTNNVSLGTSVIVALILGLMFARFSNNDWIHAILRDRKFTQETPYPSEWYGVFAKHRTYIVLHLKDERRIYGWAEEWPSHPNNGHFSLAEAEWLKDEGNEDNSIPLEGVDNILIPANEVKFVEFMKLYTEDKQKK